MAATEHVHGASLVIYLLVSVGLVIVGGVMSGLTLGRQLQAQSGVFLAGSRLRVYCLLKQLATEALQATKVLIWKRLRKQQ